MSKPHSTPDPSMEDILASIRKMISEDPSNGPRPMPDQMARTPFGEDLTPERQQEPDIWGAEPAAPIDPSLATSFSSLSEALKSSPPPGERRSLEERIAGLIETEEPDDIKSAPQPDPLSSFTARSRPTPVEPSEVAPRTPVSPGPFEPQRSNLVRSLEPKPEPLRNGADSHPVSKLSDLGETIPQRSDALSAPRADAKAPEGEKPLPFGTRSESQRVISIPSRGSSAPAPGLNGTASGAEAKNGTAANGSSSVSPFGPRPASPTLSPVTRSLQERLKEKTPVEPPASVSKPVSEAKVTDKTEPMKAEAKPASTAKSDAAPPAETSPVSPAKPASPAPVEPAAKSPADSLLSSKAGAIGAGSGPSEALLDAVVDLVQKDPGSISVFASGSAFIHGVGDKPQEPIPQELVPVPGQKLDGAAAQLLRPMLRQWLAENMPRIVEEALRSELTSSEAAEKDPKKS